MFEIIARLRNGTDDAISAVNAAVNLNDSFQQIKSKGYKIWERKVSEKIDIGLKCGINTGEVIVAKGRTEQSHTAIGSVVNYVSRFESLAKDNQILMSQTTNSRVKDKFLSELMLVDLNLISGQI